MADERLAGTGVRCFVSGGNDDFFEVDDVLAVGVVEDPNGRVIELERRAYELMGWATATRRPGRAPATSPRRTWRSGSTTRRPR